MKKLLTLLLAAGLLAACNDDNPKAEPEQEPIKEELPTKEEAQPIEVEVNAEPVIDEDNKVVIKGETNIPDGGELMFTVSGTGYDGQTKQVIAYGKFQTEPFSKEGKGLPVGDYTLSISLSVASTQDAKFIEETGEEYELLTGNLMDDGDLGKSMNYETSFTIEETVQEPEDQSMTEEEASEIVDYFGLGESDELVSVNVKDNEIKAVVKLGENQLLTLDQLAVTTYSQASDEFLNHEGWNVLTMEFVGVGSISMNRDQKETNEAGDFFPTVEIEKKLND
ncbi:hypothetical protein CSV75_01690 [Sporosarcina sp. P18a]|uniref:hypothetical protein n=1 Tax=Sporosarcina sp. P18a TaxID=2048259 RepID=UPI000C1647A5|nr:hypothetical protein [Sporosarcina sp. P18a]PIC80530.1 hypothetical protein CSV75_01690 [Sporosarcina sp. P18a]